MPYEPQFGKQPTIPKPLPLKPGWSGNQQVSPFGYTPPLSLPKKPSPLFRKFLLAVAVVVGMLVLANIAFSPAGMHRFWLGVARETGWLTGSQQGNSVGAFTLLALIVVGGIGFARHTIIRNHGSAAFGWCQITPGVVLICVGGAGWYHGHIWWLTAIAMGFGGYILAGLGFRNIQANIQPVPVAQPPAPIPERPPMPVHTPSDDIHGRGRMATPDEVDQVWRSGADKGGFDKFFED
jgi:hypothetical protein